MIFKACLYANYIHEFYQSEQNKDVFPSENQTMLELSDETECP